MSPARIQILKDTPQQRLRWFGWSALPALVLAALLSGCGKDEAPPAPKEETNADTLSPLLDELNKQQAPQSRPAQLTTLNQSLAFSNVLLGDDLTLPVVITNEGDQPLTVSEIKLASEQGIFTTSGTCAPGAVLSPSNNSCRIDVTFRPTEARQYQTSLIVVHTGTNSPMLVAINGMGEQAPMAAPPAALQPPSAAYLNAMRVQAQRRTGTLQVLSRDAMPFEGWNATERNYAGIGFEPTQSTLPVDRTRMITMDRYIPAILETNINSEIPNGPAVAVVENHVYGATGRKIVIPAGSRVRGQYGNLEKLNQGRLGVEWIRIIRPDGVGINIQNSPGLDAMGRLGMVGYVDRRYFDRYVAPLLISTFGVGLQYALSDGDTTTITSTGGFGGLTTSRTESPESQAGRALAEAFAQTGQRFVEDNLMTNPIIFVPSGTRFLILPTQDIYLKEPTLMASADGKVTLAQQAQNLLAALQRGELDQGALQLANVLSSAASAGQGNEGLGLAAGGGGPTGPAQGYDTSRDAAKMQQYAPPAPKQ